MPLFIVLNDLSHRQPASTPRAGASRMQQLVDVLLAVAAVRQDAVFLTLDKFKGIELSPRYPIGQWAMEPGYREEWRKIRSMQDRCPSLSELDSSQEDLIVDYFWQETVVKGFGYAHRLGGISASFSVEPFDTLEKAILRREQLIEREDEEIEQRIDDVEISHVAAAVHVNSARTLLEKIGRERPDNGRGIWTNRTDLFPSLKFLPRVEAQLNGLQSGHVWLDAVFDRLREMDRAVSRWNPATGVEPEWDSKVTPEHEQRKRLCFFDDIDGLSKCFDMHARFTPGCGRIHFRLDWTNRQAIVAHIGKKIDS